MNSKQSALPSLSSKEYTLLIISTLTVMAGATIAPALPEIARAFPDETELSIQLVLTIPAIFTAAGSLVIGTIIDKFGRKKPLIISILLYGISGSSGLYLNNIGLLLVGRAILGLSVAGIMTTSITLVGDYYHGEFRTKMLGLQASFMAFGGVVFIFLGGILADIGWHAPFALYLLAFFFFFGVLRFIDEPKIEEENSINSQTNSHESSLKAHLKGLILSYILGFVTVIVFYILIIFLPFYLAEQFNSNASQIGFVLSINSLFAGITSLVYSRFKSRFDHYTVFGLLFFTMGVGYLIISIAPSFLAIIIGIIIVGIGFGLFVPNINSWLFGHTHAPIRGRSIGGFATALFLGQFATPFVRNFLLPNTTIDGLFFISSIVLFIISVIFVFYKLLKSRQE